MAYCLTTNTVTESARGSFGCQNTYTCSDGVYKVICPLNVMDTDYYGILIADT